MLSDASARAYRAFGMVVLSEIPLPELPAADLDTSDVVIDTPDAVIRCGAVPDRLDAPVFCGVCFETAPGRTRIDVECYARYLVQNGREIVVEARPEADPAIVRAFLLGSAFGALLHQRGVLPLHASAVAFGEGAVLFAGESGAGKSTIAAALGERGYTALSDDIGAIAIDGNGPPLLHPGYPHLKLCEDAVRIVRPAAPSEDPFLPHRRKRWLRLPDAPDLAPRPLRRIYLLEPANREGIEIDAVRGVARIEAVMRHTYRRRYLADGADVLFRRVSSVARSVEVRRVHRPLAEGGIDDLADALQRDLAG